MVLHDHLTHLIMKQLIAASKVTVV